MISFLFWNVYSRPLEHRIARLAVAKNVDVLMLAESGSQPHEILNALNRNADRRYTYPFTEGDRIQIFTRLPESSLIDFFNSPLNRLTIRRLRVRPTLEILLCVLHFQSRASWEKDDQTLEATVIARDIARAEDRASHCRTVLVGDMNMSPFDAGMIGAQALNAMMTLPLTRMVSRTVAGRPYRCFYNPMWGLLGDRTPGPAGTLFRLASAPTNHYWYMYDQVLVRPALANKLGRVEILDFDGEESLVTKCSGRPRRSVSSDHLPIFFELDL